MYCSILPKFGRYLISFKLSHLQWNIIEEALTIFEIICYFLSSSKCLSVMIFQYFMKINYHFTRFINGYQHFISPHIASQEICLSYYDRFLRVLISVTVRFCYFISIKDSNISSLKTRFQSAISLLVRECLIRFCQSISKIKRNQCVM